MRVRVTRTNQFLEHSDKLQLLPEVTETQQQNIDTSHKHRVKSMMCCRRSEAHFSFNTLLLCHCFLNVGQLLKHREGHTPIYLSEP